MLGKVFMTQAARSLSGVRFLIIEDEMVQAMRLSEMLSEMGGAISHIAFSYNQAREVAHQPIFDCAVLDVNLGGTLSFPIADTLKLRGIPFVFCTAFADGMDAYADVSTTSWVDKPVHPRALEEMVLLALKAAK